MDSQQTDADVARSKWPTRVGLVLAALLGALLFLYFLLLFVGLWMRTGSFSPIQIVIYFGTPALELLVLVVVVFRSRHNKSAIFRNLLLTVWLAIVLNLVLTAIGTFTF
jgi:hypothetical protein